MRITSIRHLAKILAIPFIVGGLTLASTIPAQAATSEELIPDPALRSCLQQLLGKEPTGENLAAYTH